MGAGGVHRASGAVLEGVVLDRNVVDRVRPVRFVRFDLNTRLGILAPGAAHCVSRKAETVTAGDARAAPPGAVNHAILKHAIVSTRGLAVKLRAPDVNVIPGGVIQ